jgi:hypothetical protein
LRIFRGDHDFEAFSAFRLLSILDVCAPATKGASASRKAPSELRFMTEIARIKVGCLGREPLGGGGEAGGDKEAVRSATTLPQWSRGMTTVSVANVSHSLSAPSLVRSRQNVVLPRISDVAKLQWVIVSQNELQNARRR